VNLFGLPIEPKWNAALRAWPWPRLYGKRPKALSFPADKPLVANCIIMNISTISSATTASGTTALSVFQKRALDFRDLQSALQSGDLTAAQTSFAALQKKLPDSAVAGRTNSSSQLGQIGKDFQALQSALQSGDLSAAQSAFATLKQDLPGARGIHGAHRHHHQAQPTPDTTTNTDQTDGSVPAPADATSGIGTILDTQV
jgi:hypothetical protein